MSKQLKIELFNIYDVVIFEDENGITQDCVCTIGKEKDEVELVDIVQCNNHSISIHDNGSYKVWEKDGKDLPYYSTDKKIIHLYTLKNDNRFYDIYPIDDYGVTENINPSEALECLERTGDIKLSHTETCYNETKDDDCVETLVEYIDGILKDIYKEEFTTIKQALLKQQEPKNYLKWEDLEFDHEPKYIDVKMNDNKYKLVVGYNVVGNNLVILRNNGKEYYFLEADKQFFNDLHLERVKE